MKIVFISSYQGKVERGVENYVKELALRLKSLGNEVEILTSFWQLLRNQKRPGLPVGERPGLNIIYPLNGYWQTLGCRLYAWLTGAKLVVGGHAGIGRDDRWNLYMFPDLFIAFSQKGFDWANKVNPFVKIIKIPHGVNLEKFNPNVKAIELDLDKPRFVTVSHLVPYKRVGETVRAVAKLERGSLLVLGEGPLAKEIDELGNRLLNKSSSRAERGDLSDSMIATSSFGKLRTPRNDGQRKRYLRLKVAHSEMPKYLNACDVFTLVSEESEAFGLVYLEALACNLPVVATDDSLRRELVGDAGLFIKNPENSDSYSRILQEASEKDWKDIPRKQAEKFGWDIIVDSYERIFSLS
jgi:glycosyltransferase involved in cell wall biosynthesis